LPFNEKGAICRNFFILGIRALFWHSREKPPGKKGGEPWKRLRKTGDLTKKGYYGEYKKISAAAPRRGVFFLTGVL